MLCPVSISVHHAGEKRGESTDIFTFYKFEIFVRFNNFICNCMVTIFHKIPAVSTEPLSSKAEFAIWLGTWARLFGREAIGF